MTLSLYQLKLLREYEEIENLDLEIDNYKNKILKEGTEYESE